MRPLHNADAALINDLWHANNAGTLEIITRLIAYNNNVGVYVEKTGELVAWCIRLVLNSLSCLISLQKLTNSLLYIFQFLLNLLLTQMPKWFPRHVTCEAHF